MQQGEHELVAKDYERALTYFRKVYTVNPKNVTAIVNMGFCYAKLGRYSHAQKCFTTALDLNPHNIVARRNLARILRPQGSLTAGVPSSYLDPFKKQARPKEAAFVRYMELAHSRRESGNFFSAVQYFERASTLHPELIDPYLQAASCYEELNEVEHACSAYKRALSIYPSDTVAKAGIKRCCKDVFNENDTEQAVEDQSNVSVMDASYQEVPMSDLFEIEDEEYSVEYEAKETSSTILTPFTPDAGASSASDSRPAGLTEKQAHALQELGNIGASYAKTTLSTMPGTPTLMNAPEIKDDDYFVEYGIEEASVNDLTTFAQDSGANGSDNSTTDEDTISDLLSQYTDEGTTDITDILDSAHIGSAKRAYSTMLEATSTMNVSETENRYYSAEETKKTSINHLTPFAPDPGASSASDNSTTDEDMINDLLAQYADEDATDMFDVPHTGNAPAIGRFKSKSKTEGSDAEKIPLPPVVITEEQADALQELGNIGASYAATTLSTMLGTTILMNVPEIKILTIDDVQASVGDDMSAFAIFTMEGEFHQAGYVMLQVAQESIIQMSAIMLGMPNEPREMNEMDESAITEIGNIMVSAFLDGAAELLGIIMLPSPPQTIMGKATHVIRDIVDSSDINCESIVFFKTEMVCDDFSIHCNILVMPSQSVLYEILEMLENVIKNCQNN